MTGATRRAALLAAPALLLGACGGASQDEAAGDPNVDTGTEKQGDAELLQVLLEREAMQEAAAGRVAGEGATRRLSRTLERQARAHATALDRAHQVLVGKPAPDLGFSAGGDTARDLLTGVQRTIAVYLDAVPKLADPRVRRLAAGMLADHAAAAAQLRLVLDEPPVPEAFVA